jgi:arylsulfatase A-like enzyme
MIRRLLVRLVALLPGPSLPSPYSLLPTLQSLLLTAAALLGLLPGAGSAKATSQPAPTTARPNVLFLLTDDQRADTLRAFGNRHIHTPNLDRLARAGTRFTEAHIMGAQQGAVCVPSRAMLLSGRSLFRIREDLRDTPTWPAQFRQAGWHTHLNGKWHNTAASIAPSFSSGHAIFLGGMTDQNVIKVRDLSPNEPLGPERTVRQPSSELFADAAVRFLTERPPATPFVLYVAFTSPHDPRTPPAEFLTRYRADRLPLPANFLPQHPFDNGELEVRDEKLLPRPRDPAAVRREIAAYYGMISHVDAQIGRILDALEATGQASNTYIVWAGDNGLALGSHGLLGKQNLYEHSTRVPLIVAGPGIPKNRRTDALVYLFDLAPTLCELGGVPPPPGSEGRSLVPVLQGRDRSGRETVFTAYRDLQRAVRDRRWKLIEYPKAGRTQLFDLRRDPLERTDLSTNPRHAQQRGRLETELRAAQREFGDPRAGR